MKFAISLIKIFCGILSASIFGAFIYYLYRYQHTSSAESLQISNFAFICFLFTAVIFSMLFITFDSVSQNKYSENKITEELVEKIKSLHQEGNSDRKYLSDLLRRISIVGGETNMLIKKQFEQLNEQTAKLCADIVNNTQQITEATQQLTDVCKQMSTSLEKIEKDENKIPDHTGNFDVLIQTVSRLNSDMNDMNGMQLDAVNKMNKTISDSIKKNNDTGKDLRNLLNQMLEEKKAEDEIKAQNITANKADNAIITQDLTDRKAKDEIKTQYKTADKAKEKPELKSDFSNDTNIALDANEADLNVNDILGELPNEDNKLADDILGELPNGSVASMSKDKQFSPDGTTEFSPAYPPENTASTAETANIDYSDVKPVSLDYSEDGESQLSSIFNDKLAMELADLDILKDDNPTPQTEQSAKNKTPDK